MSIEELQVKVMSLDEGDDKDDGDDDDSDEE